MYPGLLRYNYQNKKPEDLGDKRVSAENSNKFPSFIYGTAWKEDATADLVEKAVSTGFSAIDTANPFVMQNPEVQSITKGLGRTPEQVVF